VTTPSLVSVVIPVWNGERFLRQCLDSVLAQEHRPLEIIVVDDGSTDGSARIAAGYASAVRVLRQENRGPAAARNAGLDAATGEYIAFNDCDDLWQPGKLARQLEVMTRNAEVDLCLTWAQNFWEAELAADAARYADHPMSRPYGGYSIQSVLLRARSLARLPRLPEELRHGETAVWMESVRAAGGVLHTIEEVLVRRRLHASNMTRLEVDSANEGVMRFLQHRLRVRRGESS